MSESHFTDNQRLQNLELFGEYLRNLRKTGDEKKIEFAEKSFWKLIKKILRKI